MILDIVKTGLKFSAGVTIIIGFNMAVMFGLSEEKIESAMKIMAEKSIESADALFKKMIKEKDKLSNEGLAKIKSELISEVKDYMRVFIWDKSLREKLTAKILRSYLRKVSYEVRYIGYSLSDEVV